MRSLLDPAPGEWYVIPQSAARVADQYADTVRHRWIVARGAVAGEIFAFHRTTTPGYPGIEHDRHPPRHEVTCRLDRSGTICSFEGRDLLLSVLGSGDFSCSEPDDDVLEEVMRAVRPPRRPGRRRR